MILALLFFFLLIGIVFLFVPINTDKKQSFSLEVAGLPTKEIKAIIMFISLPKPDDSLENSLPYHILSQMSSQKDQKKMAWLIHGDDSFLNAYGLLKKFENENFSIQLCRIKNIYDARETFLITNNILLSENHGINPKNIVCDSTSGPKPVTIGITLAAIRSSKLIYFPKISPDTSKEYIEVKTDIFFEAERNK